MSSPSRIQTALFICLSLLLLSILSCKKDGDEIAGPSSASAASIEELLQSHNMLDLAYDRFLYEGSLAAGNEFEALEATTQWLLDQPEVATAFYTDSSYLHIRYTSGLENKLFIEYIEPDGTSLIRGGGVGKGKWHTRLGQALGSGCSNPMQNNKVLFFSAAFDEFDLQTQQAECLQLLADSDYNFEVTTLKNEQCTPEAFLTFPQYGLVLLDTHGAKDGTMCGLSMELESDSLMTPAEFNQYLLGAFGQVNVDRFLRKELYFVKSVKIWTNSPDWFQAEEVTHYEKGVYMHVSYIAKLGSLDGTILYNNSCHSGMTLSTAIYPRPIASEYLNKNPLAYFGWARDNMSSNVVLDSQCQIAELSFAQRISDTDSTGIAYLMADGTEFESWPGAPTNRPEPTLKLFRQPTWCFNDCGPGTMTDSRDGKVYATTCIDGKTWMAENLNYAASGMCFNGTANCNTYGRIYDWDTASGGMTSNTNPSGIQGVCPDGWHLPSMAEWNELIEFAGGTSIAGRKLKAVSPLWEDSNTNTDEYGFAALPGGECSDDGSGGLDCFNQGDDANFWSSSDQAGQYVYITGNDFAGTGYALVENRYSCRCVED